jgi:hypothetical protein
VSEASRSVREAASRALCNLTLVNVSRMAYAYPAAIEDLTLHEQGRVMLAGR